LQWCRIAVVDRSKNSALSFRDRVAGQIERRLVGGAEYSGDEGIGPLFPELREQKEREYAHHVIHSRGELLGIVGDLFKHVQQLRRDRFALLYAMAARIDFWKKRPV
jgi:hypothetical protein